MPQLVLVSAMASAFLHAAYNLVPRIPGAPRNILHGASLATATICLLGFPFLGLPSYEALPWIAGSTVCNIVYLGIISRSYETSDFTLIYTIVRAVVPCAMTVMGWMVFAESGRSSSIFGLAFVFIGMSIFCLKRFRAGYVQYTSVFLPTAGGFILAVSMICDILGIRACGKSAYDLLRYSCASSLATAIAIILVWSVRGISPVRLLSDHARTCYAGAFLLLGSYLCGMWAYSRGPISLVAPVRESSILIGGLLAVIVLRERICRTQWVAMVIATIGIIIIQVG